MTKILIGLALVCLEMPLSFETVILGNDITILVDLFPDVLGFILLLFGHRDLAQENDYFYKNIKFSLWCATVAAMIFIMDLLGMTARGNFQPLLMRMLLLVLESICLFRIVRGVRQVEKDYEINIKGKLFLGVWIAYTVITALTFLFSSYTPGDPLVLLQATASFAYVALFFKFRSVYEEIRPVEEPEADEEE